MSRLRTLDRKLLRDAWRLRGQVLAISVVIAAASATLILSMGTRQSLIETRDAYYDHSRFADVFAHAKRAPEHLIERIRNLPGVAAAETRIAHHAVLDMPMLAEPVRGTLVSLPEGDDARLNAVTIRSGGPLRRHHFDDVVVHEAFAEAHGLKPGAVISATINGKLRKLQVVGIGLSPEFVYAIGPGDLVPDPRRYGILWMGRQAMAAAYDLQGAFNDVALRLRPDASTRDVIDALDALLERYGGNGAYARKDQISNAFIESEIAQLATLTRVVPPIFLLVAAFLVNVVMTRLIQTERAQIGLLKAFGYADAAIGWHYLKFAFLVSLLGTAMGWAAGAWMGSAMTQLYAEYYRFPVLYYRLSLDLLAGTALLAVATAWIGALLAVRRAVMLAPAVAMTPPPPPIYRRGIVDRLGLAHGVTPAARMVQRHITRWPMRSMLTISGLALAVGLLITTLHFFDAIDEMLEAFFFRSQRQDMTLRFTELRGDEVAYEIQRLPGVRRVELRRIVPASLSLAHRTQREMIFGLDADSTLSRRFDGHGRPVALPPEGLILTERLAQNIGARVGDEISVQILEGRREKRRIHVVDIVPEYIGTAAYMERGALNRLLKDGPIADAAYVTIDPRERVALFRKLKDMPGIFGITVRDSAVATFRELIDRQIGSMLAFYVGFASILAIGVAYNAARVTLAERAHEFATLRLLGYHEIEVAAILIGELLVFVLVALPLGCLVGYALSALITYMFSTDLYRMPFVIAPATFGLACATILAAVIGTSVVVARRGARLDLIASLKTRE